MAWRRIVKNQYDFALTDEDDPWLIGEEIWTYIGLKGYCVMQTTADSAKLTQALKEVRGLDHAGRFAKTPRTVLDGLLGEEGSVRYAELAAENEVFSTLEELDEFLSTMAQSITTSEGSLAYGFTMNERTAGLVHEAGILTDEAPRLRREDVKKWLPIFMFNRLMLLFFIGPKTGTLELKLFDGEAEAVRVTTAPGMLIALRADTMAHTFGAVGGDSYCLSCFMQQQRTCGVGILNQPPQSPVAMQLDQWAMDHVEDLVADPESLEAVDASWKYALEHLYHKGQATAVRGVGCRQPSTWDPPGFFGFNVAGGDVVTEIPLGRWNHMDYYHDHEDGWKYFKVNVKHVAMTEGLELFDAKFFRISPAESKGMDPMQRIILEVGYAAMHAAGKTAKTMLQSLTGVYVACHGSEWPMVDQGPEESGGCEQRSAGTGFAGSIQSNRFSFVFGMNGPSITIDTDAAAGISVLEAGTIALDTRKLNATMSMCAAVTTVLSPLTWIHRIGLGQMSQHGRAFSFDQSATGWTKCEGIAAFSIDNLTEIVEGVAIQDEGKYAWGVIASSTIRHAGKQATLGTPHGASYEELVQTACREAGVSLCSIDAVECMGDAQQMNDAIEVTALMKVLRGDGRSPVSLSCVKTQMGNHIQGSAGAQILKVIKSQQHRLAAPMLHFRQINPQMTDVLDADFQFLSDALLYPVRTSLVGVTAVGWGGAMGHVVMSCGPDPNLLPPPRKAAPYEPLIFWPGGGGEEHDKPSDTYYINGTWCEWDDPRPMRLEAEGIWTATVTLGVNRFEEFNILFDGKPDRVIHALTSHAPSGTTAVGPAEDSLGNNWLIDGRMMMVDPSAPALTDGGTWAPAEGRQLALVESTQGVGDIYKVRLNIAGKWRAVTWEWVGSSSVEVPLMLGDKLIEGRYYVMGNFNVWSFEEMSCESAGFHSFEVRLMKNGGEFQICRNRDPAQVFHPKPEEQDGATGFASGPDDADQTLCWLLNGVAGDIFRIEFHRDVAEFEDTKRITWRKLRHEPLTAAEKLEVLLPRYFIAGTWDNWRRLQEMPRDGLVYEHVVTVGDEGTESFQIIKEGNWNKRVFPTLYDASPHVKHGIHSGDFGHARNWTIGKHETEADSAGVSYKVMFSVHGRGVPKSLTWERLEGRARPAPVSVLNEIVPEVAE